MRLIPIIPAMIKTNEDPIPEGPEKNEAAAGVVMEGLPVVTPVIELGDPFDLRGNVVVSARTGGLCTDGISFESSSTVMSII
jgi:hypothetical protein